jgi:aspartyl/asparaginyl-tRNA synthetase
MTTHNYHEVMNMLDEALKAIFCVLRTRYQNEIEIARQQFLSEEFRWREGPEGTLKLTFHDAIELSIQDGVDHSELDDIK